MTMEISFFGGGSSYGWAVDSASNFPTIQTPEVAAQPSWDAPQVNQIAAGAITGSDALQAGFASFLGEGSAPSAPTAPTLIVAPDASPVVEALAHLVQGMPRPGEPGFVPLTPPGPPPAREDAIKALLDGLKGLFG